MTEQEIREELAKVEKSISWLEWATGPMGQLHWDIRIVYDHHVAALEDAKSKRDELKRKLASLS